MPEGADRADALRGALRDLRIELAINTTTVAALAGLHDSDLAVLDIVAREGTGSPTDLARRTGIHPATMTGVLARLEKAGWITRRPDTADGRRVELEAPGFARLTELYRDANRRLDQIAAELTDEQADVIIAYLRAVIDAAQAATGDLRPADHAAARSAPTAAAPRSAPLRARSHTCHLGERARGRDCASPAP